MKTKLALVIVSVLLAAGLVGGSVPVKVLNSPSVMKGYMTIGKNVVVLPERLQRGDQIDFYNSRGSKVFEQFVGSGYLAANISKLPQGFYDMVVYRKGTIVTSQKVPLVGNRGR